MKYVSEFIDRNKNPVILSKERQQEILVEKIDRAMELAGFRRKERNTA